MTNTRSHGPLTAVFGAAGVDISKALADLRAADLRTKRVVKRQRRREVRRQANQISGPIELQMRNPIEQGSPAYYVPGTDPYGSASRAADISSPAMPRAGSEAQEYCKVLLPYRFPYAPPNSPRSDEARPTSPASIPESPESIRAVSPAMPCSRTLDEAMIALYKATSDLIVTMRSSSVAVGRHARGDEEAAIIAGRTAYAYRSGRRQTCSTEG